MFDIPIFISSDHDLSLFTTDLKNPVGFFPEDQITPTYSALKFKNILSSTGSIGSHAPHTCFFNHKISFAAPAPGQPSTGIPAIDTPKQALNPNNLSLNKTAQPASASAPKPTNNSSSTVPTPSSAAQNVDGAVDPGALKPTTAGKSIKVIDAKQEEGGKYNSMSMTLNVRPCKERAEENCVDSASKDPECQNQSGVCSSSCSKFDDKTCGNHAFCQLNEEKKCIERGPVREYFCAQIQKPAENVAQGNSDATAQTTSQADNPAGAAKQ